MAEATLADMLRTIEAEYRLTGALTGRSTLRPEILAALAGVDRRGFVPASAPPRRRVRGVQVPSG